MNLRATLLSFIKDHCCNFAFFLIGYRLREEGKQNTLLVSDLFTQKSRNLTEVGGYQHTALTQRLWERVQLWVLQNPKNMEFLLHFHSSVLEDVLTCRGNSALSRAVYADSLLVGLAFESKFTASILDHFICHLCSSINRSRFSWHILLKLHVIYA